MFNPYGFEFGLEDHKRGNERYLASILSITKDFLSSLMELYFQGIGKK